MKRLVRLLPSTLVAGYACLLAAGEPLVQKVSDELPARFVFTFHVAGNGSVQVQAGSAALLLQAGGKGGSAAEKLVLGTAGGEFELYGLAPAAAGRLAHAFLDGRHAGTLLVTGKPAVLSIRAEGDVKLSKVRFSSLPDVRFADDFMRGGHTGDWKSAGGLHIEQSLHPELSSSPFRLVSTSAGRSEMRTGSQMWWQYSGACAVRLPARAGAAALLGTHLRATDGLWAALERNSGGLRFRVFSKEAGRERELLLKDVPEAAAGWHELAVSPGAAALDGEAWPLDAVPVFAGGEAAVGAVGEGVMLDDVRFESAASDESLQPSAFGLQTILAFLAGFWEPPGTMQPVFRSKDDMAAWSRGRFLWNVDGERRSAGFRYPLSGGREVTLAGFGDGKNLSLRVQVADGTVFAVKRAKDGQFDIEAEAGGQKGGLRIPAGGRLCLSANSNGLSANSKRLLAAEPPLAGGIRVERVSGNWPGVLEVSAAGLRDYTFSRAPAHFEPLSGNWDITARWRCSPEYNWFGGLGDPAHVVYRYRLEGAYASVALAFAPGTQARNRPFYNYPVGLTVALSPDARDAYAGAAVVWEVLTASSKLLLRGAPGAEYKTYATDMHAPDSFQAGFERMHRRWDVIRLLRRSDRLSVSINDDAAFEVSDPVLANACYLHLLAPAKNVAMLSRLCVSAERLAPAASRVRAAAPAGGRVELPVDIGGVSRRLPLVVPPAVGAWGMFMGATVAPDELMAIAGGFKALLRRPGVRWATGVRFDEPVAAGGIRFNVALLDLPRAAVYLDTDYGPAAAALAGRPAAPSTAAQAGELPAGPYHSLHIEHAGGEVRLPLEQLASRFGGYPHISGIYWGELERDEAGAFGLASHVPGRHLLVSNLRVEPPAATPAAAYATRLSSAPVKVLAADGKGQFAIPYPPLARALNGDAAGLREVAAMRGNIGYTDGAGAFVDAGGLRIVNPRMGGPAGVWVSREPVDTRRCPLLYLEYEHLPNLPALPWNLVAATPSGKVAWNIGDNNQCIPVLGTARRLSDGGYLLDLDRAPGDTLHALALMDAPRYSSVEWSGARLLRLELGAALKEGDTLLFEGAGSLRFALLKRPGSQKVMGTAEDGRITLPALSVSAGDWICEVTDGVVTRRLPLRVAPERPAAAAPAAAPEPPEPLLVVLPAEGFVRTAFTEADPVVPLLSNRRGVLPVLSPPANWLEPPNRGADALGGGLVFEVIEKPREGYHIVKQDSGLPDGQVLRLMYAAPPHSDPRLSFVGRQYSITSGCRLAANEQWTWLEMPVPNGTDAICVSSERYVALRAVSVAAASERRFQALVLHPRPEEAYVLRVYGGGRTVVDKELPAATPAAGFELPAAGQYAVTAYRKDAAGALEPLNTLTLTTR